MRRTTEANEGVVYEALQEADVGRVFKALNQVLIEAGHWHFRGEYNKDEESKEMEEEGKRVAKTKERREGQLG